MPREAADDAGTTAQAQAQAHGERQPSGVEAADSGGSAELPEGRHADAKAPEIAAGPTSASEPTTPAPTRRPRDRGRQEPGSAELQMRALDVIRSVDLALKQDPALRQRIEDKRQDH